MEVMQVISDVLAGGDMIINVVALGFETYVGRPIMLWNLLKRNQRICLTLAFYSICIENAPELMSSSRECDLSGAAQQ